MQPEPQQRNLFLIAAIFLVLGLMIGICLGYTKGSGQSQDKISNLKVEIDHLKIVSNANSTYLNRLEEERNCLREERDEAVRVRDIVVKTLDAFYHQPRQSKP